MTPILTALAVVACYAMAVWGWLLVREQGPAAERLDGGEEPGGREPGPGPVTALYDAIARRLAPRAHGLMRPAGRARVRARLDAAGRPRGMTVEQYAGRKAAYTVLMAGAGLAFLVLGNVLIAVVLPVIGFFFIDIWLRSTARRRQEQIDRSLPDFLDILAVSVSAGVGFMPALRRVAEITGGPLGEEFALAQSQIDVGASRREAFTGLRTRNRSESLSKFVAALLQAEELGVPLTDALADLATDMRRTFYQQARRRAANAAPRVSLVVTLLIVPGAIILIITAFLYGSEVDLGGLVS